MSSSSRSEGCIDTDGNDGACTGVLDEGKTNCVVGVGGRDAGGPRFCTAAGDDWGPCWEEIRVLRDEEIWFNWVMVGAAATVATIWGRDAWGFSAERGVAVVVGFTGKKVALLELWKLPELVAGLLSCSCTGGVRGRGSFSSLNWLLVSTSLKPESLLPGRFSVKADGAATLTEVATPSGDEYRGKLPPPPRGMGFEKLLALDGAILAPKLDLSSFPVPNPGFRLLSTLIFGKPSLPDLPVAWFPTVWVDSIFTVLGKPNEPDTVEEKIPTLDGCEPELAAVWIARLAPGLSGGPLTFGSDGVETKENEDAEVGDTLLTHLNTLSELGMELKGVELVVFGTEAAVELAGGGPNREAGNVGAVSPKDSEPLDTILLDSGLPSSGCWVCNEVDKNDFCELVAPTLNIFPLVKFAS
jgi:hypothetical protein